MSFYFETGFCCVVSAGLEPAVYIRLASMAQVSACLCLQSAETEGMCHRVWLIFDLFLRQVAHCRLETPPEAQASLELIGILLL